VLVKKNRDKIGCRQGNRIVYCQNCTSNNQCTIFYTNREIVIFPDEHLEKKVIRKAPDYLKSRDNYKFPDKI
jgi:hypothetical protein